MPLAGLGLSAGAGLEALVPGRLANGSVRHGSGPGRAAAAGRRTLATAAIAGVVLAAHAATSDRLLATRLARRYLSLDLPFDPQLRKSDMARRAEEGLRRTSPGPPRRIVLCQPSETSRRLDRGSGAMRSDSTLALEGMLMYRVLDGGLALRALFPGLDSVAFVNQWTPGYVDFDLCVNSLEGEIVDLGRGPDAHLRLGRIMLKNGYPALAVAHLARACEAYPRDPRLRQMLSAARAGQALR